MGAEGSERTRDRWALACPRVLPCSRSSPGLQPCQAAGEHVCGGGERRERRAEASRPRPGHGTSVGLGTGIDPLGGSARARIASCHNNLLLSSRLIDGAELAPHEAPGAPSLLSLRDPGPSPAPWGPPQPRHPAPAARPGCSGPAPCPLLPCPLSLSPHRPTLPLTCAFLGL